MCAIGFHLPCAKSVIVKLLDKHNATHLLDFARSIPVIADVIPSRSLLIAVDAGLVPLVTLIMLEAVCRCAAARSTYFMASDVLRRWQELALASSIRLSVGMTTATD